MAKNQKSYTPEFKQQIVDLYNAGGTSYPQLEREYGVNRSTISGWVKQLSPIRVSEGGAEAVELGLESALCTESNLWKEGKRSECNVVYDAESEVVFGLGQGEVLKYAEDLSGSGVLRRETVAAADDEGGILLTVETLLYVEVERFAVCTWFFGTVEHCDTLCGGGHCCEEVLGREGAVEVYCHEAHFLAFFLRDSR